MAVNLLLGLQWGDEGKGKIVDVLTQEYDIIARFQGGPNAGHTLEFNGIKHVLHTIPSGIFHESAINIVGNGVVIDPIIFKKEIEALKKFDIDLKKRLLISRKAHLILPTHRLLDAASETSKGKAKIGSTLKGIGPTYMDKTGRNGLRVGDIELDDFKERYRNLTDKHEEMISHYNVEIQYNLAELEAEFFEAIEVLKSLQFIDSEEYIHQAIRNNKKILAEGAQGSLLDIDFGTYPFVTSSNTTAAGACTGLGVAPTQIGDVLGIFKAYTTRVGSGPFPTELFDETGETMGRVGKEFGATTGRKRRCGWLDLVALRYAVQINGVTQLMMMKADVLSGFDTLKVCTAYLYKGQEIKHLPYNIEEQNVTPIYTEMKGWAQDLTTIKDHNKLPQELLNYIDFLEKELEVPITLVSVGPDRTQTIHRK
ncbi:MULTISPECIES: adenylosuccinate synthase [Capnocytophaga]|uniref:adenylosuccinate synthase n=1 Tax=Capnocytophaga TaxID=1016 RepID=UPI0005897B45|nr:MULTISPECIES: adenylosuccinate synthase [Capnocytophaga]ATA71998.1 adenylosuccinate synthase [Capnocytophaga sp. H4358]CEN45294.1 Adenylosuccinate synthetase [Capnocytophaga canis]